MWAYEVRCTMGHTILFVSHSSGLYGAEKSLLDLVLNCPDSIDPIVLAPESGELTDVLTKNGVEVITLGYSWWIGSRTTTLPIRLLKNTYSISQIPCVSTFADVDLVYTNSIASPVGGLIARQNSVPNIWHIRELVDGTHGLSFDFGINCTTEFIERSSKKILYNSQTVRERYLPYLDNVCDSVIYNGPISRQDMDYNDIREEGVTNSRIRLLVVGSISPGKGQLDAIKILDNVLDRGIDAELTIVGSGDEAYIRNCKAEAESRGLGERIHWEGYQKSVDEYFRGSDIAVVPSKSEAFGRVVVEAMSFGIPVLGRDSGGIPEIIRNASNGYLFTSISQAGEYADKLSSSEQLYRKISERGWKTAYQKFSREQYCESVFDQIHECLSGPST